MQKQTYLGRRTKAWSLFEQRINVVTIVLWAHVETSNFLTLEHLQSLTPWMVGWGSSAFCTVCIGCVWWVCPYWPPPVHVCTVIFLLVSSSNVHLFPTLHRFVSLWGLPAGAQPPASEYGSHPPYLFRSIYPSAAGQHFFSDSFNPNMQSDFSHHIC